MPKKFQHVRQNFATGEVTPRMSLRHDWGGYGNALRNGQNFLISTQGTALFREGYEHIGRPPSNRPYRVFQFHRGGDDSDLLLEVSAGLIRYWVDDQADGVPYLFEDLNTLLTDEDDGFFLIDEDDGAFLAVGVVVDQNPYAQTDLDSLYFTNQDKYGVLCSTRHPTIYITLERNGQLSATPIPQERIPLFAYQDTKNPAYSSLAADWRITFPESWSGQTFLFSVTYNGVQARYPTTNVGITYSFSGTALTNAANIEAGLTAAAVAQGFSTAFSVVEVSGSMGMAYDITVSGADSGWVVDCRIAFWPYYGYGYFPEVQPTEQPLVQPVAETSDAAEELAWSYPTMVLHDGSGSDRYYQALRVHNSSDADTEPGVGAAWEQYWDDLGIGTPVGFDYQYPGGNDWAVDQTYAPGDRGFPTVAVFNEQRLILMANKDNPTALYGSALGYYFNFKPGANDDDPFIFVLDSSDTPQIKWARSQRNLTLGTSSGEWVITAQVTITPTDISARQQNNARAELTLPAQIDTEIFYIEQGGRKVRVTRYYDEANSLISQDASVLAEHLIAENGVKRIVVSFIPEVFITLVGNDGQVVYFAYEKTQPVLAFTHALTDGFVHDAASYYALPQKREHTYYAVERDGRFALERMRYPCGKICTPLTENKIVHLDGWVTGTVSGDTISGLDHLENQTVWVLVDDAWQIGEFVVQAGQITLPEDEDGKLYAVGLPYEGDLETFEVPENTEGTGFGTKRRWNRLFTRILNSSLPRVYTDRTSDRHPSTPMGTAETIQSGLHDIQQNTAGHGDGSIRIVQDRPYPLQVLGFFGEFEIGDRS